MVRPAEKQELADQRRAQILRAAVACMARKGYAHTTMDDIARECGLSKGALYWYYASKRDVFLAAVQETLGQMLQQTEHLASDTTNNAAERLAHILDTMEQLFEEGEDVVLVTVEFWALSRHDSEFMDLFRNMHVGFLELIEDVVAAGVASGEFRPLDAEQVARILMGTFDGLFFHASVGIPVEWTKVSKTLQNLLRHGLGEGGTP